MSEQRSYHFKPNPNLPTHYAPALRNHENLSYGGGAELGPRPGQNYHQAYAQPRIQEHEEQRNNREEYQGQKRLNHLKIRCYILWGKTKPTKHA